MPEQPETDTDDSSPDSQEATSPAPSAALTLADLWPEGEVWFRKFLPTQTAWGTEELLDPVPEEQRGLWAIQLGAPALIGERRRKSGEVVPVENAATIARLIDEGKKITAISVPWFERLIPAILVTPTRERIQRKAFLKSLLRPLLKSILICVAAVVVAIFGRFPMLQLNAIILGILFGVYPLMQVVSLAMNPIDRVPVTELNRRRVNHIFFFRRFRKLPYQSLKILLAVLALVFVGQWMTGSPVSGLMPSIDAAALVKFDVVEKGEWWRVLTAGLMHSMFLHLAVNGLALYSLGRVLCAVANPSILMIVFVSSVITGGLASLSLMTAPASVGASGGVLGCLGFLLVVFYRYRQQLPGTLRINLVHAVIVISVLGYLGRMFIDNAGHAGGFLGGVVIALLMWKSFRLAAPASKVERALGIVSGVVVLLGVAKIAIELWGIAR